MGNFLRKIPRPISGRVLIDSVKLPGILDGHSSRWNAGYHAGSKETATAMTRDKELFVKAEHSNLVWGITAAAITFILLRLVSHLWPAMFPH